MAMTQVLRQKETTDVSTWNSIMPNPTVSRAQSEMFVKKLVALGVSNLTYIRALFPEDAYVSKQLEGVRLKILRDDGSCNAASKLISWLKGAFDAFSKKYLRQLVVAIHAEGAGPDEALETYSFYFTYKGNDLSTCNIQREKTKEDKVSSDITCSLKEVRQTTLEMLRTTIHLTQSLPVLPDKCAISVKLLYFEDLTPHDYEPPGFYSVPTSSFNFPSETISLKIGEVNTPFHGLKFKTKLQEALFANTQINDVSAIDSYKSQPAEKINDFGKDGVLNESLMSEDVIESSQSQAAGKFVSLPQPEEALSAPSESPAQPVSGESEPNAEMLRTPTEVRELGVFCACGIKKDGGLMVKCTFCNKWQHGACYGLLNQTDVPPIHVCELCHKPEEQRQCTDPKLLTLSIQQRQEICLYRRALRCIDVCRISPEFLSQELDVTDDIAQLLFELLDRDGILRKSKGLTRSVNLKLLKCNVLPHYFGSTANLILHKFIFNLEDPVMENAKCLKEISITQRDTRNKRKRMNYVIEEDEPPTNKKQKASRGAN